MGAGTTDADARTAMNCDGDGSCGADLAALRSLAKALFCHPNTVRYRLNRVTEHTGRSLTDPQAVTELSLALQADRLARCA
jgi:hypothetical protein